VYLDYFGIVFIISLNIFLSDALSNLYGAIGVERVRVGFMPNYLVSHQHGEVHAPATVESDRSDDEDQMDDMIADTSMEYGLGSGDQHPLLEV
jgi:hypothetical protein